MNDLKITNYNLSRCLQITDAVVTTFDKILQVSEQRICALENEMRQACSMSEPVETSLPTVADVFISVMLLVAIVSVGTLLFR